MRLNYEVAQSSILFLSSRQIQICAGGGQNLGGHRFLFQESMQNPIILGIDPGTRYMGVVVLCGQELLSYGVHTLRNGERPYDVVGQAKRIVLKYVARWSPTIVAYEEPLPIATRQGAILRVIADELRGRGKELGLEVWSASPAEVRKELLGNPRATKLEVAQILVDRGFEELRSKLPQKPKRSALGLRPRDKYWLHVFDALAVAAVSSSGKGLAC